MWSVRGEGRRGTVQWGAVGAVVGGVRWIFIVEGETVWWRSVLEEADAK